MTLHNYGDLLSIICVALMDTPALCLILIQSDRFLKTLQECLWQQKVMFKEQWNEQFSVADPRFARRGGGH